MSIRTGLRRTATVCRILLRGVVALVAGGLLTGLSLTFSGWLLAPVGVTSPAPFRLAGMLLYVAYLLLLLRGYSLRRLLLMWLAAVLAGAALLLLLDVRTDRVNFISVPTVRR